MNKKYYVSTTLLEVFNPETKEIEFFITIEDLEHKLNKQINLDNLKNFLNSQNISYRLENPEYTEDKYLTLTNKKEAAKFINLLNKNKI